MLAAKTSLAARVDALGEDGDTSMGIEHRAAVELRLKALEENQVSTLEKKLRYKRYPGLATYRCGCHSTLLEYRASSCSKSYAYRMVR